MYILPAVIIVAAAALSLTACGSPEITDVAQEPPFTSWREPLYTEAKSSYIKAGVDPLIAPAVAGCYADSVIGWLRAHNCPNVAWGSTDSNDEALLSQCLANGFREAAVTLSQDCVAKFAGQRDASK